MRFLGWCLFPLNKQTRRLYSIYSHLVLESFISRAHRIKFEFFASWAINHGSTAMQCPPTPGPGWSMLTLGCRLANWIKLKHQFFHSHKSLKVRWQKQYSSRKLFSAGLHNSAVLAFVSKTRPLTNVR